MNTGSSSPLHGTSEKWDSSAGPKDFDESGALTREFLLQRGECCREGCRNCPYGFTPRVLGEKSY